MSTVTAKVTIDFTNTYYCCYYYHYYYCYNHCIDRDNYYNCCSYSKVPAIAIVAFGQPTPASTLHKCELILMYTTYSSRLSYSITSCLQHVDTSSTLAPHIHQEHKSSWQCHSLGPFPYSGFVSST